jgi:hypothetical protein
MAIREKKEAVHTVARLKRFLEGLPEKTPLRDCFDDRLVAMLWKKEKGESGPTRFITFESE